MKEYICPDCGWWDLSMKYSDGVIHCNKCSSLLINKKAAKEWFLGKIKEEIKRKGYNFTALQFFEKQGPGS